MLNRRKKRIGAALPIAFALVLIALVLIVPALGGIAAWPGWDAVSGLSALLASVGLIFLVYQFSLQQKEYSINQVQFLMDLAPEFEANKNKHNDAWRALRSVEPTIDLPGEQWHEVTEALEKCYASISFLYRIARLTEANVIDSEILYLLYYEYIIDHLAFRLDNLVGWSRTGVDLGANYDIFEVERVFTPVRNLFLLMEKYQREHGGGTNEHQVAFLEKVESNIKKKIREDKEEKEFLRKAHANIPNEI